VLGVIVMGLALTWLLYALFPFIAGGWLLTQWAAVSAALFGFGVVMFVGAATAIGCALWLLFRLGRPRQPLWIGAMGSVVSGAALYAAVITHIFPCSGPD
jgi:hypothetical protein